MQEICQKGTRLLVATDMMKSSDVIHAAYNNRLLHAFKINILRRINLELGGDFNIENFLYEALYDTGKTNS